MEVTKDSTRELTKRKETLVLSGRELDREGLDWDVQELFRYKYGGTDEVHKWVSGD